MISARPGSASSAPPDPRPLIAIVGPTASGKTGLAIALARALGGEILSADSRQVYRRCDIVTAKPTPEERSQAPHHLIDIAEPDEAFSAAQWAEAARAAIEQIQARGHIPIVCGGTGFYVRALLEPERIAAPAADEVLRADLERQCDSLGLGAMHARLQVLAPERAAMTHPNDRYRIVRALGIALGIAQQIALADSGSPASTCEATSGAPPDSVIFGLRWSRSDLYARIEGRVDAMIAAGAWDEARGLLGSGLSRGAPALSGVGYKQIIAALDGQMSTDAAVALWKQESRRYAKRQATWFSNQMSPIWLEAERGAEAMVLQATEALQVLGLAAASSDEGARQRGS